MNCIKGEKAKKYFLSAVNRYCLKYEVEYEKEIITFYQFGHNSDGARFMRQRPCRADGSSIDGTCRTTNA